MGYIPDPFPPLPPLPPPPRRLWGHGYQPAPPPPAPLRERALAWVLRWSLRLVPLPSDERRKVQQLYDLVTGQQRRREREWWGHPTPPQGGSGVRSAPPHVILVKR